VSLDAESFFWLRDMLLAKRKYTYLPGYLALVNKTLVSFQDAERGHDGDQPRKRTVPRKVAKSRTSR
jgi:hypothetical protein